MPQRKPREAYSGVASVNAATRSSTKGKEKNPEPAPVPKVSKDKVKKPEAKKPEIRKSDPKAKVTMSRFVEIINEPENKATQTKFDDGLDESMDEAPTLDGNSEPTVVDYELPNFSNIVPPTHPEVERTGAYLPQGNPNPTPPIQASARGPRDETWDKAAPIRFNSQPPELVDKVPEQPANKLVQLIHPGLDPNALDSA